MSTSLTSLTNHFTYIDSIIIIFYLLISLVIGLKVKKYVSSMAEFIGAGQAVGTALGIATMAGTEMGLITIMYSAQKGFTGGFAAFHIALVAMIVTFFVGATGFIVVRLRELNVLTIPEYYEKRFNKKTRVLGGVLLSIGGILNMGLFLKIGAMFIAGITGLSLNSWAIPAIMTALLSLVLIYTCLGGMISVIITDYIQFVILSIGLIGVCFATIFFLGWDTLFSTVQLHMGDAGFNPLSDQGIFGWEYVLWMCFTAGLVSCAIWPTAVARALAMKSPKAVKKQYMGASIAFMVRFLIPNFLGIAAFVFFITKAPQLYETFFASPQDGVSNLYALPLFLSHLLPTGALGLISAAMLAAFMSTQDSYLLCWSSVITQDIVVPLKKKSLSTSQKINLTRVFIVLIGLFVLYWGLFYKGTDDIWDYLAVTGAVYFTGAFALLCGGLYWKRTSSTGAFWALIAGFSALFGLQPVQSLFHLPTIPSARVGLLCVLFTLTVLVLGSLLFPDPIQKETRKEAI